MSKTTLNLKGLWKPPHLRSRTKERHATWLELFFDLVFVLAVAELGGKLSHDLSLPGILKFLLLFIAVWYAWFHHTLFSDRFDTDNFAHRFFTIVQMFGVVGIAASIQGSFGETDAVLASSFVLVKVIMIIFYQRCVHIEIAKQLANRLSLVFTVSGILWFISIFAAPPIRYWIWSAAIISEFIIVFHKSTRIKYAVMPVTESHIVERFGLFTIIVLGESVAGIVKGIQEVHFELIAILIAGLGLLIIFGYWWIYFENLDGSALKGLGGWITVIWFYIQLPLVLSLTIVGISIEHFITDTANHAGDIIIWLLVISLALSYFSIGVTHLAVSQSKPDSMDPLKGRWRIIASVLVLLSGGLAVAFNWTNLIIIIFLAVISMAQVLGEVFIFEKTLSTMETIQDM